MNIGISLNDIYIVDSRGTLEEPVTTLFSLVCQVFSLVFLRNSPKRITCG